MTIAERVEKLALAAQIITEVRDSLNNERLICECCGFERFIDYNDRQMREQLNGAVTRLARVSDRMTRTDGVVLHPKHPSEREKSK